MKEYSATASINASADTIWNILTDVANYPAWDPGVDRIEGAIALGAKITAYTKLNPNRAFPVKVTELTPGKRMIWTGGMPLGLFRGTRTFTLTPQGDGNTEFSIKEEFSGPLLALIGRSIPDLTMTFQKFAAGLKAHAEGQAQNGGQ